MSLRKCPDCGKDVSASAPSCPHCGRPNKRSSWSIGTLSAFIVIAIGAFLLARWFGSRNSAREDSAAARTPPETVVAQPYRELQSSLTATIGYNRTLNVIRIENGDTFPWTDCQLSLNSHGIAGYELRVAAVKPGLTEAALLQTTEFSEPAGKRFDPGTERVATLDLDCETTRGRLYYGGRFPAADPTGR